MLNSLLKSAISPEYFSYARALTQQEIQYQRDILRAREYHMGRQQVSLTARLREFLGQNADQNPANSNGWIHENSPWLSGNNAYLADSELLRLNIVRIVNNAVTERLTVRTFDTDELGDTKPLAQWATDVWQQNRMDAAQDDVHEAAVREGEAYIIVAWDNVKQIPTFMPHPRYVDQSIGGDGYGVKIFYENDDPRQTALYATKTWYDVFYTGEARQVRRRITFYYPDRVEKFELYGSELRPFQDEGDTVWPIPWIDRQGLPLGIPVIPFRNAGGMNGWGGIEAIEAIPIQNAINKELIDLLAASDMTAFRVLVALGWNPVDEAGNPLAIEPGSWIGSTNPNAKVSAINGADLKNILEVIDSLILKCAQVTDTPAGRFILTGNIPRAETLKEQEAPLLSKIKKRQVRLSNGWEDTLTFGVKLHNAFSTLPQLDETVRFETIWEPAEIRNEDDDLARAQAKIALGIPFDQVALELGYDQDLVQQWVADKKAQQQQMLQAQQQPAQSGLPPIERPRGSGSTN